MVPPAQQVNALKLSHLPSSLISNLNQSDSNQILSDALTTVTDAVLLTQTGAPPLLGHSVASLDARASQSASGSHSQLHGQRASPLEPGSLAQGPVLSTGTDARCDSAGAYGSTNHLGFDHPGLQAVSGYPPRMAVAVHRVTDDPRPRQPGPKAKLPRVKTRQAGPKIAIPGIGPRPLGSANGTPFKQRSLISLASDYWRRLACTSCGTKGELILERNGSSHRFRCTSSSTSGPACRATVSEKSIRMQVSVICNVRLIDVPTLPSRLQRQAPSAALINAKLTRNPPSFSTSEESSRPPSDEPLRLPSVPEFASKKFPSTPLSAINTGESRRAPSNASMQLPFVPELAPSNDELAIIETELSVGAPVAATSGWSLDRIGDALCSLTHIVQANQSNTSDIRTSLSGQDNRISALESTVAELIESVRSVSGLMSAPDQPLRSRSPCNLLRSPFSAHDDPASNPTHPVNDVIHAPALGPHDSVNHHETPIVSMPAPHRTSKHRPLPPSQAAAVLINNAIPRKDFCWVYVSNARPMAISAARSALKDIGIKAEALLAVSFIPTRRRSLEILTHKDEAEQMVATLRHYNIEARCDLAPHDPILFNDGSNRWSAMTEDQQKAEAFSIYQSRLRALSVNTRRPSVRGWCAKLLRIMEKESEIRDQHQHPTIFNSSIPPNEFLAQRDAVPQRNPSTLNVPIREASLSPHDQGTSADELPLQQPDLLPRMSAERVSVEPELSAEPLIMLSPVLPDIASHRRPTRSLTTSPPSSCKRSRTSKSLTFHDIQMSQLSLANGADKTASGEQ